MSGIHISPTWAPDQNMSRLAPREHPGCSLMAPAQARSVCGNSSGAPRSGTPPPPASERPLFFLRWQCPRSPRRRTACPRRPIARLPCRPQRVYPRRIARASSPPLTLAGCRSFRRTFAAACESRGDEFGTRLAMLLRARRMTNMRKGDLLHLCREWGYSSNVWRVLRRQLLTFDIASRPEARQRSQPVPSDSAT